MHTAGLAHELVDGLFPPRCALCDTPGGALCAPCVSGLSAASTAEPAPPWVDTLVVLCDYSGPGADLVLALKRRNRRAVVPLLGAALAAGASSLGPFQGVTWAPTTRSRRRSRGFDQSEVIARSVSTAAGVPCRPLLVGRGDPQMGHNRTERLGAPVFEPLRRVGGTIALVDDVVTSGATMSAAAAALRAAGAAGVVGLAVARSAWR